MGSRMEFWAMVRFVREHDIRPVLDRVVAGIDNPEGIDRLFEDVKESRQFGKLVVEVQPREIEEFRSDQSCELGSKRHMA